MALKLLLDNIKIVPKFLPVESKIQAQYQTANCIHHGQRLAHGLHQLEQHDLLIKTQHKRSKHLINLVVVVDFQEISTAQMLLGKNPM